MSNENVHKEERNVPVKFLSEKISILIEKYGSIKFLINEIFSRNEFIDKVKIINDNNSPASSRKKRKYDVFTSKTVKSWKNSKNIDGDVKCSNMHMATLSRALDIDYKILIKGTINEFENLINISSSRIEDVFRRQFKKENVKLIGYINGIYHVIYPVSDKIVCRAIMNISEPMPHDGIILVRLYCKIGDQIDLYTGYLTYDKNKIYILCTGSPIDGLSLIICNHPSHNKLNPFDGIILSTAIREPHRPPFSSKILFIPYSQDDTKFPISIMYNDKCINDENNLEDVINDLKNNLPSKIFNKNIVNILDNENFFERIQLSQVNI